MVAYTCASVLRRQTVEGQFLSQPGLHTLSETPSVMTPRDNHSRAPTPTGHMVALNRHCGNANDLWPQGQPHLLHDQARGLSWQDEVHLI